MGIGEQFHVGRIKSKCDVILPEVVGLDGCWKKEAPRFLA